MRIGNILKELSKKNPIIKKSYILSTLRENRFLLFKSDEVTILDYDGSTGTLIISSTNNYVLSNINLSKNEIIKKANEILKEAYIRNIVFRR